ncbi:MAG: hypothetical protein QOD39_5099, partial [Mycobacterium sp.]|nr:hypothetical protein [Mycobacterium sp.]
MAGSGLALVATGIDAVAAVDPRQLSAETQLDEVEELLTARHRLDALIASRVAAIDDTGATVPVTGRLTTGWLVEELRLSPGETARIRRAGRVLPCAPILAAAWASGHICGEHVLVIAGVLRHIRNDELRTLVEDALVDLAKDTPPHVVAGKVDEILLRLGVEKNSADAHDRRFGQRGVGIDENFGGTGSLNGTLTPEVRAKVQLALSTAGTKTGPEDDRTTRQRWHDALGDLAEFYLTHAELPAVNGERPRIVVTLDLDTLLGKLTNTWATLDSGIPITPATARRIACDADLIPATLGSRSEVLDLGRTTRVFTTAIRRAAWIRDQGHCTYPRCTKRPTQLHHITWWTHGGHT